MYPPPGIQAVIRGSAFANGERLPSAAVAQQVSGDVKLTALGGETRTLAEWLTTFHLAVVVLDPYTSESAWLLETAGRILMNFREADSRVGWVVTADERDARRFLGPWAADLLTFVDPNRDFVAAVELTRLPALVHIRQDHTVLGVAQGWNPQEWAGVTEQLGRIMGWSHPNIPEAGDPGAFEGSPARG